MPNIQPPFLKPGDIVGITSTARKVLAEELAPIKQMLVEDGFEVVLADGLFEVENQFAGSDETRAKAFQQLLDDDSVRAILCARGGYGTVRMVDLVDWSRFKNNPKWICGFSDVTTIHSHANRLGVATIHCTMGTGYKTADRSNPNYDTLVKSLTGNQEYILADRHKMNRVGEVSGQLVGGNLSVLYSLLGSESEVETDGKILFIEDLDEYLYHIDRMMINLKRNRTLAGLKALVIGGMSDMNDNDVPFGKNAFEIIAEHVADYDYPVAFGFPIGHEQKNLATILGGQVTLKVNSSDSRLCY